MMNKSQTLRDRILSKELKDETAVSHSTEIFPLLEGASKPVKSTFHEKLEDDRDGHRCQRTTSSEPRTGYQLGKFNCCLCHLQRKDSETRHSETDFKPQNSLRTGIGVWFIWFSLTCCCIVLSFAHTLSENQKCKSEKLLSSKGILVLLKN